MVMHFHFSHSDDHTIMKWNLLSGETSQLIKLAQDVYPTDFHWFPKGAGGVKQSQIDLMVMTATDGRSCK